ncbi:hypothetical protein BH09BAC1_BH09BAC1_14630 [soil metagenome]
MKNNSLYIVIAIVLAGVVGYFIWTDSNKNKPKDEQDFATKNVDALERIFIADKLGRTIQLDKKKDYWLVNDKYKAMPAKVDFLLSTLKSYIIYSPVPEAAMDNAIKELAVHSIKVELYDNADGKPTKVYFVGKPNQGQTANYMLMQLNGKSAKVPYLVHIPGFIGDLQTRFLLTEKDWRDLTIFNYKLDDIKQVSVLYHEVPQASFILSVEGNDNYSLRHSENDAPAPQEQLFKVGITKFFDSFANINAEAEANDFAFKDSVTNGPKLVTMQVRGKDGSSQELILYHMPANRRTKTLFDAQGNEVKFDPDYYYAVYNNGKDFALSQHFVLGKLLRSYNDFLIKKEGPPTAQ